jgi:hypothetical protein
MHECCGPSLDRRVRHVDRSGMLRDASMDK